jgi:N-acetylneuraminic acid mutarotase
MLPNPADFRVGTDGSRIYLYNSRAATNFCECDPSNGVWTARANYNGPARRESAMFSLSGKIYLGAGYHYIGNERKGLDDWYVYSPVSNSWSRITDMRTGYGDDYPMSSASTVVINN